MNDAGTPSIDPRLEPETAALLRRIVEGQSPPADQTLAERRQAYTDFSIGMAGRGEAVGPVTDLVLPGPAGDLAARLYEPLEPPAGTRALVLYLHGGGFIFGDLESHDAICRLVANHAKAKVMALAYRRAPEAVYPAAIDDCLAAYRWAAANAGRLGIHPARIAVAGESAGAALAVGVVARLRGDGGVVPPAALLLMVPALDATCSTASATEFASGFGPSAQEFRWLWSQYLPSDDRRRDPDVSPYFLADLSGLPAAVIFTAECDPARDEGETFAERLRATGATVVARRGKGLVHYFPNMLATSQAARRTVEDATGELGRLLGAARLS